MAANFSRTDICSTNVSSILIMYMYLIVLCNMYVAELNVGNLDNKYCLTLHLVITLYMYYLCTNLYPYHPNK